MALVRKLDVSNNTVSSPKDLDFFLIGDPADWKWEGDHGFRVFWMTHPLYGTLTFESTLSTKG